MTQYLLFGAKATALATLSHQAIERMLVERWENDPNAGDTQKQFVDFWRSGPVKQAMEGFAFDYMADSVMKAIYGEEEGPGEFAWGSSFAPGAGSEFLADKLNSLFALDVEGALGTSHDYYSKLLEFGGLVRQVATAKAKGVDDQPFSDRLKMVVDEGLVSTFPMYGKLVASSWALERDAYITQGGQVGDPYNHDLEVQLEFVYGLQTEDRESYYAARDRFAGEMLKPERRREEVRKIADTYWTRLVLHGVKLQKEAPTEDLYRQLLQQHLRQEALVLSVLDPMDRQVFNDAIAQRLEATFKKEGDTAESIFVESITGPLAEGGFGSEGPQVVSYLRHLPFIQNNPAYATQVEQAWQSIMDQQIDTGSRPSEEELE
jgi:hypothetical protein